MPRCRGLGILPVCLPGNGDSLRKDFPHESEGVHSHAFENARHGRRGDVAGHRNSLHYYCEMAGLIDGVINPAQLSKIESPEALWRNKSSLFLIWPWYDKRLELPEDMNSHKNIRFRINHKDSSLRRPCLFSEGTGDIPGMLQAL